MMLPFPSSPARQNYFASIRGRIGGFFNSKFFSFIVEAKILQTHLLFVLLCSDALAVARTALKKQTQLPLNSLCKRVFIPILIVVVAAGLASINLG
jgi:hypothetical protein